MCYSVKIQKVFEFSLSQNSKTFQDFSSHRVLRHMYGALNIDKKVTNCTL